MLETICLGLTRALFSLSILTGSLAMAAPGPVIKVDDRLTQTALQSLLNDKEGKLIEQIFNAEGRDVFAVRGSLSFHGQVLKVSELVLQPGSELVFEELNVEHHIIVVDKLKLASRVGQDPIYTIRRARPKRPNAPSGQPPKAANGVSPKSHVGGRHGAPGGHGSAGSVGKRGETPKMPSRLVLIVNSVETQPGENRPIGLNIEFKGADGGNGGIGGNGGNGGNGYSGKGGDSNAIRCNRQPGDGGNGGNAGPGGPGGQGGDAGPGADVLIIGPPAAMNLLTYFDFRVEPGQPGVGGSGGAPGSPGIKGRAGHRRGWCQSQRRPGVDGQPASRGIQGERGKPGRLGRVRKVKVKSIDSIFLGNPG